MVKNTHFLTFYLVSFDSFLSPLNELLLTFGCLKDLTSVPFALRFDRESGVRDERQVLFILAQLPSGAPNPCTLAALTSFKQAYLTLALLYKCFEASRLSEYLASILTSLQYLSLCQVGFKWQSCDTFFFALGTIRVNRLFFELLLST